MDKFTNFMGIGENQTPENIKKLVEDSSELLNIFDFIKAINFKINPIMFNWFWQVVVENHSRHMARVVFNWFGYEGEYFKQKNSFLKLLDKNNIPYKELRYNDDEIKNYPTILEEIQKLPHKGAIASSKFLIMAPRNIKKAILKLNTKKGDLIRDYYIDVEELLKLYSTYTYEFQKLQTINIIEIKNNEIESEKKLRKEAENKTLILKEKIIDLEKLKENQFFYISSSKSYAKQNRFKIGGVKDINQVESRMSQYNTRSAEGDSWEFIRIYQVNDYKLFEDKFWGIFDCFRDKTNSKKEMIVMRFDDLEKSVVFMIENYHKEIIYFNTNLEEMKKNAENISESIIPEPIKCLEFVERYKIENGIVTKRFSRNFPCDYIISRGINKGKNCKNMTGFTDSYGKHLCYRHK